MGYRKISKWLNQSGIKTHRGKKWFYLGLKEKIRKRPNEGTDEVWSGFRVANRAKVFDIKKFEDSNGIKFSACHDGFKKLKEGVFTLSSLECV